MNIVIVGGGHSGWLSALMCSKKIKADITVIESKKINVIGVGEGTVPMFYDVFKNMGYNIHDVLSRINGTFKQAVKFNNWNNDQTNWWHLFWTKHGSDFEIDQKEFNAETLGSLNKSDYFWNILGEKNLVNDNALYYAYHYNSHAFVNFLKEESIKEKVNHIYGHVVDVSLNDTNDITSLILDDNTVISNIDFLIDCSGFNSIIFSKQHKEDWYPFNKYLFNNKAIVLRRSYKENEQIEPYTTATSMKHGWCWKIPTYPIGYSYGYVHCDEYVSSDNALEELQNITGIKNDEALEVKFKTGMYKNPWKRNYTAIGISSGFVEPLEATGIAFSMAQLELLCELLPLGTERFNINRILYNQQINSFYENLLKFILGHFLYCKRNDTNYWKDIHELEDEWFLSFINNYEDDTELNMFGPTNWSQMLLGLDYPFDVYHSLKSNGIMNKYDYTDIRNRLLFDKDTIEHNKALRIIHGI